MSEHKPWLDAEVGVTNPIGINPVDYKSICAELQTKLAEQVEEVRCITVSRDSWRKQSKDHNIARIELQTKLEATLTAKADLRLKMITHITNLERQLAESKLDTERVLTAIETYCGDDFCEDLDIQEMHGMPDGSLKQAHLRLSAIYKIAHAFNGSHSCYAVHDDWRKSIDNAARQSAEGEKHADKL